MSARFVSASSWAALAATCVLAIGAAPAPTHLDVTALPPDRVQRLTANGIKTDDPELSAQLKALAVSRHSLFFRTSKLTTTEKPPAFSSRVLSRPIALEPPQPQATASALLQSAQAFSGAVFVNGNHLLDSAPPISASLTLSNCPVTNPLTLMSAQEASSFGLPPNAQDRIMFNAPFIPKNESGQLTTVVNGVSATTNITDQIVPDSGSQQAVTEFVDYNSPYIANPDPLGEGASSFVTTGSHISTSLTDPVSSGTDTLGAGTFVVNGWTVKASISDVHSYQDSPNDNGSNDQYRSATISEQPSSGRLETKVAWTYQGGESISSILLTWTFSNGPWGARFVTTMPKTTTCSDEQ